MPNSAFTLKSVNEKGQEMNEVWEAFTDAYNYKYLYCKETETYAYYVNDGMMFYFTAFYGDKKSMLYYFYLSAYKVFLGNPDPIPVRDAMPLNIIRNRKLSGWIHDFIAPFYNYIRMLYSIKTISSPTPFESGKLELESEINVSVFGKCRIASSSTIFIENNAISGFRYKSTTTKIEATCINT
jgi:hypothetical protein